MIRKIFMAFVLPRLLQALQRRAGRRTARAKTY